jgi:hypothetical protein
MNSTEKRCYSGSCHCELVKFRIRTDLPELTTCNCSICRRKNALLVKVHERDFELVEGVEVLSEYKFHTNSAKHYFCSKCGIYPFHRKRTAPECYGINVHCLEDIDLNRVPIRETEGVDLP